MGSSVPTGAALLGFLADARSNGVATALDRLDLASLVGRPTDEIMTALADQLCPDGGSIDQGIARRAFLETVADLQAQPDVDLGALTENQMLTILESFTARSIYARLCNDIGARIISLPLDAAEAASLEVQIQDFIRRTVSDAIADVKTSGRALTADVSNRFVEEVYQAAFQIMSSAADAATTEAP